MKEGWKEKNGIGKSEEEKGKENGRGRREKMKEW